MVFVFNEVLRYSEYLRSFHCGVMIKERDQHVVFRVESACALAAIEEDALHVLTASQAVTQMP